MRVRHDIVNISACNHKIMYFVRVVCRIMSEKGYGLFGNGNTLVVLKRFNETFMQLFKS